MNNRPPMPFTGRPRGKTPRYRFRGSPNSTGWFDTGFQFTGVRPPHRQNIPYEYYQTYDDYSQASGSSHGESYALSYLRPDYMHQTSSESSIKTYSNSPEVVLGMMRHDVVFKVLRTSPQYHVVVNLEGKEFFGVGDTEKSARIEAAKKTMLCFYQMIYVPDASPPVNKQTCTVDGEQMTSRVKETTRRDKSGTRGRKEYEMQSREETAVREKVTDDSDVDDESDDGSDHGGVDKFISEKSLDYDQAVNVLFRYIVEEFEGIVSFTEFMEKCSPGKDIRNWFKKQRHVFHVFEDNGEILFIAPFLRDAAYCLDYCGITKRKKCNKEYCDLFHICQHFMRGYCRRGFRCRKSHDYSDEHNLRVKQKLRMGTYRDADISNILINRYPQACPKRYCRGIKKCPYLHICRKFILGKCTYKRCKRGHFFNTEHNSWVLRVYDMENAGYRSILNVVSIARLQSKGSRYNSEVSSCDDLDSLEGDLSDVTLDDTDSEMEEDDSTHIQQPVSTIGRGQPSTIEHTKNESGYPKIQSAMSLGDSSIKEDGRDKRSDKDKLCLDDAGQISICYRDVVGMCQLEICRFLHTEYGMPYLWQVNMDGEWRSFSKIENEKIEKEFCAKQNIVDSEIPIGSRLYKLHVRFGKEFCAVVYQIADFRVQKGRQVELRRLSTPSYAEDKIEESPGNEMNEESGNNKSFCTQWRWYFEGNIGQWKIFQKEEEQTTLERKYLSGQKRYHFSRCLNNYNYCINFDVMEQINLDTGRSRSLLRRPLYVSENNLLKRKFPRDLSVHVPIDVPSHWSPLDVSGADFELVELEKSFEFRDVQRSFHRTFDEKLYEIDLIYRVQNWSLWNAYLRKRNMMIQAGLPLGDGTVDERNLFHEADSLDTCRKICKNSFDLRIKGLSGEGSYFINDSKLNIRQTTKSESRRWMFRAKVLVGNYTKGERNMTHPPEIAGASYRQYDACVDDVINPTTFVIFDANQSYPEYLIQYSKREEIDADDENTHQSPTTVPMVQLAPDDSISSTKMTTESESSKTDKPLYANLEADIATLTDTHSTLSAPLAFPTQKAFYEGATPNQEHIFLGTLPNQEVPVLEALPTRNELVSEVMATHEVNKGTFSTQKELVGRVSSTQEKLVPEAFQPAEKVISDALPTSKEMIYGPLPNQAEKPEMTTNTPTKQDAVEVDDASSFCVEGFRSTDFSNKSSKVAKDTKILDDETSVSTANSVLPVEKVLIPAPHVSVQSKELLTFGITPGMPLAQGMLVEEEKPSEESQIPVTKEVTPGISLTHGVLAVEAHASVESQTFVTAGGTPVVSQTPFNQGTDGQVKTVEIYLKTQSFSPQENATSEGAKAIPWSYPQGEDRDNLLREKERDASSSFKNQSEPKNQPSSHSKRKGRGCRVQ